MLALPVRRTLGRAVAARVSCVHRRLGAAALAAAVAAAGACGGSGATDPGGSRSTAASRFTAGLPVGWFGGSNPAGQYDVGTDQGVVHGGARSASIRSVAVGATPGQFGVFGQQLRADAYRGKRVRLSGWVRTQGVQGDGAGVWLRIDGVGVGLLLDNSEGRRLAGTTDWRQLQAVLDVPAEADALVFGVLLIGSGQAWFDDLAVDAVGPDVPTTFAYTTPPSTDIATVTAMREYYATAPLTPANLDFEGGASAVRGPVAALRLGAAAAPRR